MQAVPITKEKKIVIKAINKLGRRVSPADIATNTGLPIAAATLALNQIASQTSGHLQVSAAGDIAYQFPIGYQSAYISSGIKRLIEKFGQRLFQIGFFLLRISFGIMLILSLLTIVLVFFIIISASSRSKDNDDFIIDLDFFDWMILQDLLFWQFDPVYYDVGGIKRANPSKTNFLYSCFSFLFGDGNPNINLEERRWHAIAELIRQKQGAVTAEQLAPYTGSDPNNEDAVLPTLVRFDGRPTVTDSGNIVYLFPALQAKAAKETANQLPPYLNIFPWQFSQAETGALIWVMVLAAVNFLGSWYLYIWAAQYISFAYLSPLLLVLVIYGTLFVAIPLIRYTVIQFINKGIDEGNKLRQKYAAQVSNPDTRLTKKLAEAEQMLLASRQIKAENIIYDTQKDVLEQEFPTASNA